MARHALRLVPVLLAILLSGCAWLTPNLHAPHLRVLGVRVLRADFWQQQLEVRLRVRNPNSISLPIESLQYSLALDGHQVAHGRSSRRFTVPPNGTAEFNTEVTANMAGALFTLFGRGGARPVRYRLRGKVELARGLLRELPFDERGQFVLK
jgi:LEA14-like dessication related protein